MLNFCHINGQFKLLILRLEYRNIYDSRRGADEITGLVRDINQLCFIGRCECDCRRFRADIDNVESEGQLVRLIVIHLVGEAIIIVPTPDKDIVGSKKLLLRRCSESSLNDL